MKHYLFGITAALLLVSLSTPVDARNCSTVKFCDDNRKCRDDIRVYRVNEAPAVLQAPAVMPACSNQAVIESPVLVAPQQNYRVIEAPVQVAAPQTYQVIQAPAQCAPQQTIRVIESPVKVAPQETTTEIRSEKRFLPATMPVTETRKTTVYEPEIRAVEYRVTLQPGQRIRRHHRMHHRSACHRYSAHRRRVISSTRFERVERPARTVITETSTQRNVPVNQNWLNSGSSQ